MDPSKELDQKPIRVSTTLRGELARAFNEFVAAQGDGSGSRSDVLKIIIRERLASTSDQGVCSGGEERAGESIVVGPILRLWSWIKSRIPALGIFVALIVAVLGAMDWTINNAENLREIGAWTGLWRKPLDAVELSILKGQYPLEPMGAYFDVTYPMDDPVLEPYAKRLQAGLVSWLRAEREGRRATSDDLHDEQISFVVTNLKSNGLDGLEPDKQQDSEVVASAALLNDQTSFIFANKDVIDDAMHHPDTIRFGCMDAGMQHVLVTLPSFGDVQQKIELIADFSTRTFTKHVTCLNLPRFEPNRFAKSALDLVDKRFTWDTAIQIGQNPPFAGALKRISIIFPNDVIADTEDAQRYIKVPGDADYLILSAADLGFTSILY